MKTICFILIVVLCFFLTKDNSKQVTIEDVGPLKFRMTSDSQTLEFDLNGMAFQPGRFHQLSDEEKISYVLKYC